MINFALEIPVAFFFEEGSDIWYNTITVQYLTYGAFAGAVWLMDLLILHTILRYGRHLDSDFASRATRLLSDSQTVQRLSE